MSPPQFGSNSTSKCIASAFQPDPGAAAVAMESIHDPATQTTERAWGIRFRIENHNGTGTASSPFKNVLFAASGHAAYDNPSGIGVRCRPGALTGGFFNGQLAVALTSLNPRARTASAQRDFRNGR